MKSVFHGWNSGAPMISTQNKSTPSPQILWKRKLSKRTRTRNKKNTKDFSNTNLGWLKVKINCTKMNLKISFDKIEKMIKQVNQRSLVRSLLLPYNLTILISITWYSIPKDILSVYCLSLSKVGIPLNCFSRFHSSLATEVINF